MSNAVEAIVSLLAMIIFFGMVFGFFAYIRYLRYRETIELAERGLLHPNRRRRGGRGNATLKWGYVSMFLGIALTLGLWPVGSVIAEVKFPLNLGPWMIIGFVPFFFGLSLILIHKETQKEALQMAQEEEEIEAIPPHKR